MARSRLKQKLQQFVDAFKKRTLPRLNQEKVETAPTAAHPDVQQALKKHHQLLEFLDLKATATGLAHTTPSRFHDFDYDFNLKATTTAPYQALDLATLTTADTDRVKATLTALQLNLAGKNRLLLSQTESVMRALAGFISREHQWLGDKGQAISRYFAFPDLAEATEALTSARRWHREAQAAAAAARHAVLQERLQSCPNVRLSDKALFTHCRQTLPFLSATLDLEFNIEKTLDWRDVDILLQAPPVKLAAAIATVMAEPQKALLARVNEQLRELLRRVKSLPHIELLTDGDIAETVAPYYGGLNKALKKKRAKSALVAIEERAREAKYQDDLVKLNERRASYADVASYYPVARTIKRELVLYVGPTNSGKTWRALNDLASGATGAYLAPLRLLALEGQEELEKRGKVTSFLTGEERDLRPEASFVSSTIEMLNFDLPVAGVVIDEVQLLADERRGWAWLAAVVGAPAEKVIMTGSPDCIELVQDLANYLGEPLTIHACQRYNELKVASAPTRLQDVKAGTAVVCFSRRDVLRLKDLIQEGSKQQVAVVYGNLSPQVRREEARRFRSGEATVLVATDAIAMGLNLPIKEVLFYTTEKFNGEEVYPLSTSEIRQIGGRAGRYGFAQFGMVQALDFQSLERIKAALQEKITPLKPPCYIAPGHNHIRIISDVLATTSLERILTFFERAIEFSDERFARSNIDELSYLSSYVDERLAFLEVTERLTIACAPVPIRNETVMYWFLERMLRAFPDPTHPTAVHDDLHDLFDAGKHFSRASGTSKELRDAEDYLKTLTVYAWLAYRYPDVFTHIDECEEQRETVNAFVERSLRSQTTRHQAAKQCSACGTKLSASTRFRTCDACHAKSKKSRRGPAVATALSSGTKSKTRRRRR